jgi:hypothetical protein
MDESYIREGDRLFTARSQETFLSSLPSLFFFAFLTMLKDLSSPIFNILIRRQVVNALHTSYHHHTFRVSDSGDSWETHELHQRAVVNSKHVACA